MCVDQGHVKPPAVDVVLDALPNQRAAVQWLCVANLVGCHPHGPNDALVEFPRGVQCADRAAVSKSQVGDIFWARIDARALEACQVNADQVGRREGIGRFLQRLARAALLRTLARI